MRTNTKLLRHLDKLVPEDKERSGFYKPLRKFTVSRAGGAPHRSRNELLQDCIEHVLRIRLDELASARLKAAELSPARAAATVVVPSQSFQAQHSLPPAFSTPASMIHTSQQIQIHLAQRSGEASVSVPPAPSLALARPEEVPATSSHATELTQVHGAASALAGQGSDFSMEAHSGSFRTGSSESSAWMGDLERHLESVEQQGLPLGEVRECLRDLPMDHPP